MPSDVWMNEWMNEPLMPRVRSVAGGREASWRDSEQLCISCWLGFCSHPVVYLLTCVPFFLAFITTSHTEDKWSPILEPLWFSGLRVSCHSLIACFLILQWYWSYSIPPFSIWDVGRKEWGARESTGRGWGPTSDSAQLCNFGQILNILGPCCED